MEDPNTATTSTGDTTATRYYTFGGSTVAVRTNDGKLSLMLGDEQGSTAVVMPVTVQAGGALASATLADAAAVTRTAYTPYGELRGEDNPAVDRGWLGQVEDRVSADGASGTGLTYLNARYYDPATQRFISPDPLMNPGDPKTLDPYRYADNNPVVFTDATGLASKINQIDGVAGKTQGVKAVTKYTIQTKGRAATVKAQADHKGGGRVPMWINLAPTKEARQSPWDFYVENQSIALHGIVNFGGGIANGASSMINGALETSGGGMAYMAITGNSTPAIPTIPIWGDYDMYKYSSWSGSGAFAVGSFLIPGAGLEVGLGRAAEAATEAAGAATTGGSGGLINLFRAVGVREFDAIAETGRFEGAANSLEARQFATSLEEALAYADLDPSKVAIIQATVERAALEGVDFSRMIDPAIFPNGVYTVQPGEQSRIFHAALEAISYVF